MSGFAPSLILSAEYDPSRDEAIEYCNALQAAGNDARHVRLPALIHGAFLMSAAIPHASEVLAAIGAFLGEKLRPAGVWRQMNRVSAARALPARIRRRQPLKARATT